MNKPISSSKPLAVPAGRLNRFARLGSMTAGIAGNVAVQALGEVSRGARPNLRSLLITPSNINRVADQLARMRGAAMKVGQLISMDTGDVLPPELSDIMARLRDQAHFMPPKQLRKVLDRNWGTGWLKDFKRFDVRPIAAASIGQVHHAQLKDGRDVAIKVQYPGIARSIDSDVTNVGALAKISGLVPEGLDLAPYMAEARKQLHEETDYEREGAHLRHFASLLEGAEAFSVPEYYEDWSTTEVLTMTYLAGQPIETATEATQDERNRIMAELVSLMLRELFEFGVTQSDPNFANYRYDTTSGKIILLDFGATRVLDPQLVEEYRLLFLAGLDGDIEAMRAAAHGMGLIEGDGAFDDRIVAMIRTVFEATLSDPQFNFADPRLSREMNQQGLVLAEAGYVPPTLPMDVLYLQRKLGGMFLLASRLGAVLPVREILAKHVR
ncbi:MAG: AarF/ABC1/UbiB kinase family protein [Pseudomonadota bacterium]